MYIVRRSVHNPILSPAIEHAWEMVAFNPCPIRKDGELHLVYRAQSRPDPLLNNIGISTVAITRNTDAGFSPSEQFVAPSEEWDRYGCEDPRAVYFEGKYYIFYTALGGIPFSKDNIKVACAVSNDLASITEKHLVTPFNAKAMSLFPERVNGKIAVLFSYHTDDPPSRMAIALFDSIEDLWNHDKWREWEQSGGKSISAKRRDEDHTEVGAPPLKTDAGWLILYSYMRNYYSGGTRSFGIEALLLDLNDPTKVLGRTDNPILIPEEAYELFGMVPDVVFPTGAEIRADTLDIYYGAADTVCAKASLHLPHLLAAMKPGSRNRLLTRAHENPILSPNKEHEWESRLVFNPGAIKIGESFFLLYRAMSSDNTSVIGLAESTDGIHFRRDTEPCYVPRADFELKKGSPTGNSGCEDARVSEIEGRIYITYTAYNGVQAPQVAVSSITIDDFVSKEWSRWSMPVLATPNGVDEKDACIVPKKFGSDYLFMHRISGRICADRIPDLSFSHPVNRCFDIMSARRGTWESEKVGIAGVPIETKKGWLMIYHAVSVSKEYALGIALLDKDDPTTVLARAVEPVMVAETGYEKNGEIPNVVFCNGSIVDGDSLYVYYGGADSVIGVATTSLSRLLEILSPPLHTR
ncbi:hypothetical protein EBR66_04010 [bacterium]|nr:hypothetical protein [bacterium]